MEGGVDVKRRHESLLGVEAEGGHLGGMLVDEPLGEAETHHRLPLFDFSFLRISEMIYSEE